MTSYSVGIDIGGTFTDVVCTGSDGSFRMMKLPTTRPDPATAVRAAIEKMQAEWGVAPGYPDRIVARSPEVADILKKRTLTNLYNERPAWLDHAIAISTKRSPPPMAGPPVSPRRMCWPGFSPSTSNAPPPAAERHAQCK